MRVEPHSVSLKEEPGFPPNLAARPFFLLIFIPFLIVLDIVFHHALDGNTNV